MALDAKKHWILLRLTALLNIPLVVWLTYSVVDLAGADYTVFTTWLARPLNAGLLILLILSVFYHAGLGIHEIVEDYVHDEKLKAAGLFLKKLVFIALGAVCILSILKVAL